MKKIFLILLGLLAFISINAQNPPAPGSTVTNTELNKFIGTWKYISGGDELTFILEKQNVLTPDPPNLTLENIIGWHKWVANGSIIQNGLAYAGTAYNLEKHTLQSSYVTLNNGYTLQGSFLDPIKNKRCDFWLTMTDATFTQMTLVLKESPGLKPNGFQWGFSIPNNVVLIKQ